MNHKDHAGLRVALCHETLSTIKQLQNKLKREKAAHKRTRDEYENLHEATFDLNFLFLQCAGCRKWRCYDCTEYPHHTSVVNFKDGFPSTKELTWCRNCEDDARQSPWEYYARELRDELYLLDNVPDGEHVAAALIQIAWYRYKVLRAEEEDEEDEEDEEEEEEEEEEDEED